MPQEEVRTTRSGTPARAGTASSDCSSDAAVGMLAFYTVDRKMVITERRRNGL